MALDEAGITVNKNTIPFEDTLAVSSERVRLGIRCHHRGMKSARWPHRGHDQRSAAGH